MTAPRRPEWTSYAARRRVVDNVPVVPALHLVPETGPPVPLCGVAGPFTSDLSGEKEFCRACSEKWEELNGQRPKPTPVSSQLPEPHG